MAAKERRLLESWKEIAAYLDCSLRTCHRWEESLDLPIHRLDGTPKARVFAYADELDRWQVASGADLVRHDKRLIGPFELDSGSRDFGQAWAEICADIVDFYGDTLAPYLYPKHDAIQAIDALGGVEVRASKSQIAFARRRAFAWAWIPGKYLRGKTAPLVLTLSLRRRDPSPRWKEVVEPRPSRFTHHLELSSVTDIDEEVLGWLREAYLPKKAKADRPRRSPRREPCMYWGEN